jgi:hypothetical protein
LPDLTAFFASGRAVDLVIAFIVVEAVVLRLWWGRGRALDILLALMPGLCLLLAVRAALTGAGWEWVAFWITASLPAHLADIVRRR